MNTLCKNQSNSSSARGENPVAANDVAKEGIKNAFPSFGSG